MTAAADRRLMRQAVRAAARFVGRTAPNPAVGAIVARDGKVVGVGAHERAGTPHAEIHALRMAGEAARGATLYVTLEPCHHHGRTPPCSAAVLAAGVTRVVVGSADPNPQAHGGVAALRAAGVDVATGVLHEETDALIADFRVWQTQKRPYVIHKAALTWDGATASRDGQREPVSGARSRRAVHALRAQVDAVLVGARTAQRDDPDLRARGRAAPQPGPWRVVCASTLPDAGGKLARPGDRTWWLVGHADAQRRGRWDAAGARVTVLPTTPPRPAEVLEQLWAAGVYRVLLEGGATLARAFLDAGLIDWRILIYGAKLAGGRPDVTLYGGEPTRPLDHARAFVPTRVRRLGDDLWVQGPAAP